MTEPKIRFKKEDGTNYKAWSEFVVSDVFEKIKSKNKDGKITNVITNSAEFGLLPQRMYFDKDIAIEGNTGNYTIISKGDFVYNPRKSSSAPMGPFNRYNYDEEGIVSPLYTCLKPNGKLNSDYLLWYFQTDKWHQFVSDNGAQNGARHDRVGMNDAIMMSIPILAPEEDEQQKIADFLSNVDEVIAASEEEVANLEQQKKVVMQKIISQEVRFKKEDGSDFPDWEQKKLGECCTYRRGSFPQPYGLEQWYDETDGKPFIQVADVGDNMKINSDTKRHISSMAEEQSVFVKAGTLLITLQGTIGRVAITHYDAYVDRTLLIMQGVDSSISLDFFKYALYLLFENEKKKADGGIIKTITKETLTEFDVYLPSLPEQQLIADFLTSYDESITAAKQELEKWKELKKGLLQQMFV